jgi:hypothetical protein
MLPACVAAVCGICGPLRFQDLGVVAIDGITMDTAPVTGGLALRIRDA